MLTFKCTWAGKAENRQVLDDTQIAVKLKSFGITKIGDIHINLSSVLWIIFNNKIQDNNSKRQMVECMWWAISGDPWSIRVSCLPCVHFSCHSFPCGHGGIRAHGSLCSPYGPPRNGPCRGDLSFRGGHHDTRLCDALPSCDVLPSFRGDRGSPHVYGGALLCGSHRRTCAPCGIHPCETCCGSLSFCDLFCDHLFSHIWPPYVLFRLCGVTCIHRLPTKNDVISIY